GHDGPHDNRPGPNTRRNVQATAARFMCYSSTTNGRTNYTTIRQAESRKVSRARLQIGALALAVFGLIGLGAVVASRALAYDTPFGGFFVYRSGAVTSLWRAHWAGRQAGLRVRDVITAVDGEAVA